MKKSNFTRKDSQYHDGMSCYCGARGKYENWQIVYRDIIECTKCGKIWVFREQVELEKIKRPEVRIFEPTDSAPHQSKS